MTNCNQNKEPGNNSFWCPPNTLSTDPIKPHTQKLKHSNPSMCEFFFLIIRIRPSQLKWCCNHNQKGHRTLVTSLHLGQKKIQEAWNLSDRGFHDTRPHVGFPLLFYRTLLLFFITIRCWGRRNTILFFYFLFCPPLTS